MNPYQILNVSENCSDEELSKAYKALAKKYHPDVNPSPEAAKKMVEINCAYDEIKKMRAQGMSYSQYSASQNTGYAQSSYSQNATGDEKDAKTVRELAKIANIDVEKYGLEMLKAGTNLDKYTEDELIRLDAKKIEKEDVKYIIAQVNTVSIPDVLKRKAKIEEEMNKEILAKGLSLFVFVITDIVNSNSEAIVLGDRVDAISKTYEIKDNIAVMPGVVSRKKQILPLVEKNI